MMTQKDPLFFGTSPALHGPLPGSESPGITLPAPVTPYDLT
jgi:hypothetical protein